MKMKTCIKIILVGVIATIYSCGGGDDMTEIPDECEAMGFTLQQAKDSIQRGIKPGYSDSSIDESELSKIYIYEYDVEHTEIKLDFKKGDYSSISYTLLPEDIEKGTWRIVNLCSVYVGVSDIQAITKSAKSGVPVTKGSDYKYSYVEAKEIRDTYAPITELRNYILYTKIAATCTETEMYLISSKSGENYNIRIEIDRNINDKYAVITWKD